MMFIIKLTPRYNENNPIVVYVQLKISKETWTKNKLQMNK